MGQAEYSDAARARLRAHIEQALNNGLSAQERRALEAHLDACGNCADEAKQWLRIQSLLRETCRSVEAPSQLRERIEVSYREVRIRYSR